MATKTISMKPQRRFFQLERAAVNEQERTARLCFVTETPVERWFGNEILDCSPASVQLARLQATGPLLYNHDMDCLIGKVEKVWIGDDRKGYADVRFSTADDVNAIWQKVQDGTLDNVSVGYMIDQMVLEKAEGDSETYRATSWTPYEISMVSVPADIGCGIGRNEELEREVCITIEICDSAEGMDSCDGCTDPACTDCNPPAAAGENICNPPENKGEKSMERTPEQITKETRDAELGRINTIRQIGEKHNAVELATKAIDDGTSIDSFRALVLDRPAEPVKPADTRQVGQPQHISVNLRYDSRSLEPFKKGTSSIAQAEERAYEAGQFVMASIYGSDSARKWCRDRGLDVRSMSEGSGSAGGYLVPDSLASAIIDFRLMYGVARKIAQYWPMASASATVPVVASGPTAYFAGENVSLTAADLALNQVELVAKKLTALTLLSKEVVQDAVVDLANLVADRMGYSFAGKEDQVMIDGDGTSTYGGIIGLKSKLETSGMAGIYTCATNTDTPQEIILGELNGLMAKLPSYARANARFLSSPAFDELIFGRLIAAAGGNSTITLAGAIAPAFLGKPREVNEFCYSDATADLTGKAFCFYGDFKQGMLFGERQGISIEVLRERYADQDSIGVKGTERIDINCHGVGTTSAAGPIVALIGG